MSLLAQVEADLATTLESDWETAVELVDPNGVVNSIPLVGQVTDISAGIDLETGQLVSARLVQVTLRISSLVAAGFTVLPENISDTDKRPWTARFATQARPIATYKIKHSMPDTGFGVVRMGCSLFVEAP